MEKEIETESHAVILVWLFSGLGIAAIAYHSYFIWTGLPNPMVFRPAHLLFFASVPFMRVIKDQPLRTAAELAFAAAIAASLIYLLVGQERIATRIWLADDVFALDYIFCAILVVGLLEACRRAFGLALPIITLTSLLYAFFGHLVPGTYGYPGEPVEIIVDQLFLSTNGIFGPVLGASAEIVFVFVALGVLMIATRVDKTLFSLATLVVGRSKGGPAKLEVIASALFGMVSGSTSANVVATGSITIPMMKNRGYSATFAGGVEGASSTGGQIMPPIMGATAFLMAALLGIQYLEVMVAAIIPAVFYFAAVFLIVQIYSERLNLTGLSENELVTFRRVLPELHKLLPIIVLTTLIIQGYSPGYSCLVGLLCLGVIGVLDRSAPLSLHAFMRVCRNIIRDGSSIAIACAAAGIIVGVITLTGFGIKLSNTIAALGDQSTFLALLLTMCVSLIMGMGVPTPAAYITTAAVMAPALVRLEFEMLTAHMFIFFYACLSSITPPVAIGAYIAAGIAQSPPLRTAFTACRIGIGAFIVPYLFAYEPDVFFMKGDIVTIAAGTVLALCGLAALVLAFEGWYRGVLQLSLRLVLFFSAVLQLVVTLPLAVRGGGLLIFVAVYAWRRWYADGQKLGALNR